MVCFGDAVWNPQQADMYVCGYSGTCELLVVVYWILVDVIILGGEIVEEHLHWHS